MSFDWTGQQGRSIAGWEVETVARTREESADYVVSRDGKPAWLELVSSDSPRAAGVRQSWDLARRFAHRNLLQVHEAGETILDGERFDYAIFELPDDDLGEILAGRPLTEDEARSMTSAAAAALAHLHAKSLHHASVTPPNLFIIGEDVKLGADDIGPADESAQASDLRQLGDTIRRSLAGSDPRDGVRRLPAPFEDIAAGLSDPAATGWTAERALQAVRDLPRRAAATPGRRRMDDEDRPTGIRSLDPRAVIAVAAGVTILSMAIYRFSGNSAETAGAVPVAAPEPTAAVPAKPNRKPSPAPQHSAAVERSNGSWAVIAATYGEYGAAQNRAQKLHAKSPRLRPHVYPSAGRKGPYYVVLGSGLTKREAERLRAEARRAGAPRDTYVTTLKES